MIFKYFIYIWVVGLKNIKYDIGVGMDEMNNKC